LISGGITLEFLPIAVFEEEEEEGIELLGFIEFPESKNQLGDLDSHGFTREPKTNTWDQKRSIYKDQDCNLGFGCVKIPSGSVRMPSSDSKMKPCIGKYEAGRMLGEGRYAKVKLGRDRETGAPVAIKIMQKDRLRKVDKLVSLNQPLLSSGSSSKES
jgi:hypothetical protein